MVAGILRKQHPANPIPGAADNRCELPWPRLRYRISGMRIALNLLSKRDDVRSKPEYQPYFKLLRMMADCGANAVN
ncbi:MAG: hypothetical protein VX663_00685, partial [Pseudomonadota bacterium]|nr:hypothetical protein [Pseudomonadota bacterium]